MKVYEYRWRECGTSRESDSFTDAQSCPCGGTSKRDYSSLNLRTLTAFRPHFNPAVGKFVRTEADFRSALSACSDSNSTATGMDHKYESVDLSDRTPTNDDMKVLDEKARILRARGLTEKKVAVFS